MPVTAIVGEQRGDEGKGRFVDMFASEHDIVARFNGGPNAGHTVVLPDNRELDLHLLPSGIAHDNTMNVIGNGTYIDPIKLCEELDTASEKGIEVTPENLLISSAAHVIFPRHIRADEAREAGSGGQGSTKSGIAQVAADKYMRAGQRASFFALSRDELQDAAFDGLATNGKPSAEATAKARQFALSAARLGEFVTDTVIFLNQELQKGKSVLAEGAQAFLLDTDHGMFPYTTSSPTTSGGVATGLGISPKHIDRIIGVAKAVQSHVGGGPFVTEIEDGEFLKRLRGNPEAIDAERGTTTGRERRLGYFDIPQLRRAQLVNGSEEMGLTKLDWLRRYGEEIPICTAYEQHGKIITVAPASAEELEGCSPVLEHLPGWNEEIQEIRDFSHLPKNARDYVAFIVEKTDVPITMIGVGPRRDQIILR